MTDVFRQSIIPARLKGGILYKTPPNPTAVNLSINGNENWIKKFPLLLKEGWPDPLYNYGTKANTGRGG
jgi:hypothetical protein